MPESNNIKVKTKQMGKEKRFRHFLNDKDGFSSKDYLLIISTMIFFLFISVGLIALLFGKEIDPMYLALLDMVSPIVVTIVGGVMGLNAVEVFSNRKTGEQKYNTEYKSVEKKQTIDKSSHTDYTEGDGY